MTRMGLMIDYEYCCGCQGCEVSCKMEHGLPTGEFGMKCNEIGPWRIGNTDSYEYDWLPFPTKQCDLCAERTERGKLPLCVQNCYSGVIKYGPISELAKLLEEKPRRVLYAPM